MSTKLGPLLSCDPKRWYFGGSMLFLAICTLMIVTFSDRILATVFAGTLNTASLTISDSRASATSVSYTFAFKVAGTTPIEAIGIKFCQGTGTPCTAPVGMNYSAPSIGAGYTFPGTLGSINTGTSPFIYIDITSPTTPSTATLYTFTLTGITNTSTPDSSFYANLETFSDNAKTASIDNVWVASAVLTTTSISVTADIGAAFTFDVLGVDPNNDSSGIGTTGFVNSSPINIVTTPNTIPFGTLGVGTTTVAAHDIRIITNSAGGYKVTLKYHDPDLSGAPIEDGTNQIDSFTQPNSNPLVWSDPDPGNTANIGSGYFGYTTEDFALLTPALTGNRFSGNKWAGPSTTAEDIMDGASATAIAGEAKRIGWQVAINAQQPAGNYSGTVILVATPTY